jgi:hypothetical protein
MPTIAETLKATGFSDEQISALDPKLITVFTGIQTSAEQARDEAARKASEAASAATKAEADRLAWEKAKADAELLQRSNSEFYENSIVPGLTSWKEERDRLLTEKTNADALAAFLKTQNDGARANGFIPTDAPAFTPPAAPPPGTVRNAQGQFVPNVPGSTPGSPTFTMEQIDQRLGNGISNVGWAMQEYQRLTGGQYLPDSFDQLANEATQQKLPFRDYVARKYNFAQKQQEIVQRQQQEQFAKERADERAKADAEWKTKLEEREKEFALKERQHAERSATGSPVSVAVSARIPELQRQVVSKELPDPLMMNENQRRANTAKTIRDSIAEAKGQAA